MRFLSFSNLFRLIQWSLGGRIEPDTTNSTGFSSDNFLPEQRERDAVERGICIACSCLTLVILVGPSLAKFEIGPAWLARLPDLVIAAPGALWIGRMWLPRRRPMDTVAISVGAFTLSPWLVPYSIGILLPLGTDSLLCPTLGWQFLATLATLLAGLGLDVAAEMRNKDAGR